MSSADSWREIEELFFRLEPLSESQREAILDAELGDREALRAKVENLLAASSREEDRIGRIVDRAVSEHASDPSNVGPEERIGAFRILELLGEGGMGQVYAAERVDGEYRQHVAIKWIKIGLGREFAEQRFRQERQVLAQLDHPNIARLLDGGSTPDGRPYLVMELIQGEPIDLYSDRLRLSIDARLDMFLQVCRAVRHAHANLVVHRDIKPSNILVTEEGAPKLLDFGIAALLQDQDWQADAGDLSASADGGPAPMTPEYASPEQVREEPITTAADVYSLGLLLYRLLTGGPPYDIAGSSREELRRTICETEARKPSQVVSQLGAEQSAAGARARGLPDEARWRRKLAGDLDAIMLKALQKEPRRRYDSVDRFIEDIQRYFHGQPVLARQGGWAYRSVRFLRRNGGWVAAVGATILALSIGLIGQMQETRRANREAATSAQAIEFLENVFSASDPYATRAELSLRDVLDRGVSDIEEQLRDQPLVQARLMSSLGRIFHNRGWFKEADPLFRGALDRRQNLLSSNDPQIATSHLGLADNLRVLGQSRDALPHYEIALEERRRHFGDASVEVAEAENNFALALIRLGDLERANQLLSSALEKRRRLLGEEDPLVAQVTHNQLLIALDRGELAAAFELGSQTLAVKKKILDPTHPSLGRTQFMMAAPALELGRFAQAEELLTDSLAIFRAAWGEEHRDVLAARGDLAFARHLQGEKTLAEQETVLADKIEHLGEADGEVAHTLHHLAKQCEDESRLDRAELHLRRALELRRQRLGDEHNKVAGSSSALGTLLIKRGALAEAAPLLTRALEIQRADLPSRHPDVARTLMSLADLWSLTDQAEKAELAAREAVAIFRQHLPDGHVDLERAEILLAELSSS